MEEIYAENVSTLREFVFVNERKFVFLGDQFSWILSKFSFLKN